MAIQPIDLQTMYSQMNNIARNVAHSTQGAQLAQSLQEGSVIQQNMEKAQSVHKAADNESKSGEVNEEGHQSSNPQNSGKKKEEEAEQEQRKPTEIRESYLGQHIDITR